MCLCSMRLQVTEPFGSPKAKHRCYLNSKEFRYQKLSVIGELRLHFCPIYDALFIFPFVVRDVSERVESRLAVVT